MTNTSSNTTATTLNTLSPVRWLNSHALVALATTTDAHVGQLVQAGLVLRRSFEINGQAATFYRLALPATEQHQPSRWSHQAAAYRALRDGATTAAGVTQRFALTASNARGAVRALVAAGLAVRVGRTVRLAEVA